MSDATFQCEGGACSISYDADDHPVTTVADLDRILDEVILQTHDGGPRFAELTRPPGDCLSMVLGINECVL